MHRGSPSTLVDSQDHKYDLEGLIIDVVLVVVVANSRRLKPDTFTKLEEVR
jgi:hypothetical protein